MAGAEKVANDNPLHLSWHDSAWFPILNRENVLKYFSERSNSFYDSTCNNEIIKMQQLSLDHLKNMTGIEYTLLHSQEPILYIIRKQMRHSQNQVTALADYYIIAGTVYQAPDVRSITNSRMTSALHHIGSAFTEANSYSRYHPSKGYWWQFNDDSKAEAKDKKKKVKKEEPGSLFQCRRVDQLLDNLSSKFPHKFYQIQPGGQPIPIESNGVDHSDVMNERVNDASGNISSNIVVQPSVSSNTSSNAATPK